MPSFSFKAIVVCMTLVGTLGMVNAQAASKTQAAAPAAATTQKASLLGGKLAFTLPAGFVQGDCPRSTKKPRLKA